MKDRFAVKLPRYQPPHTHTNTHCAHRCEDVQLWSMIKFPLYPDTCVADGVCASSAREGVMMVGSIIVDCVVMRFVNDNDN